MNIEKAVHWHKIVIVKSKGFSGDEPVHANVRVIKNREEVKYRELDIVETSQIITINPKVPYPYLTLAVKKIIKGGENIAVANGGSEYFFDSGKYDFIVERINKYKSKLEEIKTFWDAEQFETCPQ